MPNNRRCVRRSRRLGSRVRAAGPFRPQRHERTRMGRVGARGVRTLAARALRHRGVVVRPLRRLAVPPAEHGELGAL